LLPSYRIYTLNTGAPHRPQPMPPPSGARVKVNLLRNDLTGTTLIAMFGLSHCKRASPSNGSVFVLFAMQSRVENILDKK